MKKIALGILLACSFFLTACGSPADNQLFSKRGFDPTVTHKLLNVKLTNEPYSHSSFGFGAFLFVAGGGGSSSSGIKSKIAFIIATKSGAVALLKVDSDKVDFQLDKKAKVPYVRLYYPNGGGLAGADCFEESESLDWNLNYCLDRAMLYLAPSDFSQDIAVIKYAGAISG